MRAFWYIDRRLIPFRWCVTVLNVIVYFRLSLFVLPPKYAQYFLRWHYTLTRVAMSDPTPSNNPQDNGNRRGPKEKPLDPHDCNDNAFLLVCFVMVSWCYFLCHYFFSALIIWTNAAPIPLIGDAIQCPPATSPTNFSRHMWEIRFLFMNSSLARE